MEVVSGLTAQDPDGNWRKFSVTVGEADLYRLVVEGKLAGYKIDVATTPGTISGKVIDEDGAEITVMNTFRALQRLADTLVIRQLEREGVISSDEAGRQIVSL